VIVVVLSVTPEKLRGELTRWLMEISTGVYVGHLSARVRERLWLRIVEDVSRGRALMVWSARNEQRLQFRVHNHAWTVEDFDGIALMRRQTAESMAMAKESADSRGERGPSSPARLLDEGGPRSTSRTWSMAGRRRRFRNAVEQRHKGGGAQGAQEGPPGAE
jgi:CRISPR-associated protein Cas2